MFVSPWARGYDPVTRQWIGPTDLARAERWNARLPQGDGRRIILTTTAGNPVMPGQWSGDPSTARVLLLLLNPSYGPKTEAIYDSGPPEVLYQLCLNAMGHWDAAYPNPWLHPSLRGREPWCSFVVFGALHRTLTDDGMDSEDAWQRLSQRCAVLELGPWPSLKWSSGAFAASTALSVQLASAAVADPDRIVLLGRGEDDWRSAGLLDVDVLPKSRGVRSNQSRITRGNFPDVWDAIVDAVQSNP